MIFVGLKRYFISTISNHSLSVQLRVLTAETMEISASLNKLVVVKGQAGSTTEAVLFRSIFCKIRWEQQVPSHQNDHDDGDARDEDRAESPPPPRRYRSNHRPDQQKQQQQQQQQQR